MTIKKIYLLSLSLIVCNLVHAQYPQKIYVNSIHKCGTHLLTKAITLLTGQTQLYAGQIIDKAPEKFDREKDETNIIKLLKYMPNNEFLQCHMRYSLELENDLRKNNYKVFFIYRDPRDRVVSEAYWAKQNNKHTDKTISEIISNLIKITNGHYKNFLGWKKSNIVCTLKFENLVGPNGGGNAELQKIEIKKICKYLGIKSKKLEEYCINNLWGDSHTFRKGEIGNWKKHFTKEQKSEFKRLNGKLLIELGYEKDYNW